METRPSRRAFLRTAVAAGIAPFLPGCGEGQFPDLSFPPNITERQPISERERTIKPGDAAYADGTFYLSRNGRLYSFSLQDFAEYRRVTKFDMYGRKVISGPRSMIEGYKIEQILASSDIRAGYLDLATNVYKNPKNKGGEAIRFFSGFTDASGVPYNPVRSKETFSIIRGGMCLAQDGWTEWDMYINTYGESGLEEFDIKDTIQDPKISIEKSAEIAGKVYEDQPGLQDNYVCHSLGGVIALDMVMKYPDCVNNLVFLNSPLLGFRPTADRRLIQKALPWYLRAKYGVDIQENATEFLFKRWEDKKYRKKVEEFVKEFTAQGKKIVCISVGEDPVVPTESAFLPGAENILIGEERIYSLLNGKDREDAIKNFPKHGEVLWHPKVLETIRRTIGKNLAPAA